MIEIVWEFIVKENAKGRFELIFGPGGQWSKLFDGRSGYKGTSLLHDTANSRRYLAIDFWETEALHERALTENETEHSKLMTSFADLIETVTEIGCFRARAEATVRPRGKARPKRSRATYRGSLRTGR